MAMMVTIPITTMTMMPIIVVVIVIVPPPQSVVGSVAQPVDCRRHTSAPCSVCPQTSSPGTAGRPRPRRLRCAPRHTEASCSSTRPTASTRRGTPRSGGVAQGVRPLVGGAGLRPPAGGRVSGCVLTGLSGTHGGVLWASDVLTRAGGQARAPHRPGGGGQGTWAVRKHSEAGYGRPVDRGVWTAKTVKRPRQQPAHPQYANYWAPLTRKRHIPPNSAQPRHTNYWAPRTRKRHQQEHRP